ncbi:M85 family metallopeptidase [Arsenophonus nasoniae]|uniref:M85 family metallopeptidase n=1 Tax=Arsenophonus nasoniae TaxID=638 RepID=D2TXF1_9GAMM|nr:M85 family metallopeptidase [Arsenophonus nasoniae]QBY44314.1 NFkB-p65-degrading zinc protease [Arsenophonus nasoniae]WGM04586.1 M85 family metallopeptidase [Arsenophonus nasoniae]WGM09698.1 M85 family metallopeptidase [Arsenophonus nasoniae]WGM14417.1 M85 family metallopeptidase [Arsenophonus nasoniae]CBA72068.1 non-LEE encoded type III effector C [Arsenophonus nasoniae]
MKNRNEDAYASYVCGNDHEFSLSDDVLTRLTIELRTAVSRSYHNLLDRHTAYAIEDTIREALLMSQAFQRIIDFSIREDNEQLGFINYRNVYELSENSEDRRLRSISIQEIEESNAENMPIIIHGEAGEDANEHPYVNISPAPSYTSRDYNHWQSSLIHELIHHLTGASDPESNEDRLGPTEILTQRVAIDLNWHIPQFRSYNSPERLQAIRARNFRSLLESIDRHPRRENELLERLISISENVGASSDFSSLSESSNDSSVSTAACRFEHGDSDDDFTGSTFFRGAKAANYLCHKKVKIIFENDLSLEYWHLKKYNLIIAELAVSRVENGSGFYNKKYKSWKEWYHSSAWKTILGTGIYDYGLSEIGKNASSKPYGFIFEDGSFSVGVTSDDAKKYGYNDTWTNYFKDDKETIYAGQMFFDKNGRPIALTITNKISGYLGKGLSSLYIKGGWTWNIKDTWDIHNFKDNYESLDRYAPRFLIKNKL